MEKKPSPKGPSLRQFQARFPTEDSCLEHLKLVRYGERHDCAKCGKNAKYYRVKARRSYECEFCGHQIYPTAGTPFEKTRTSLCDWFYVMFLFTTTRNGVAAKRVQREIGVTYKTAWRMCRLIRQYMGYVDGDDALGGFDGQPVEVDHGFVGGRSAVKNKLEDKKIVLGMVERGGNVIARHLPERRLDLIASTLNASLKPGSHVVSDAEVSFTSVLRMRQNHTHTTIKRSAGEFKVNGQTTGHVEGFWNLVKRGISGTYISVSQKHMQAYLSEFEFRYNLRKAPHLMLPLLMTSFARGV